MTIALAIIATSVAAVSTGVEMISANASASAQLEALKIQGQQEKLKYQTQSLENLHNTSQVLDAQVAQASARGYALHSASFNAIQRKTVNTGAKTQINLDISHSLTQQSIRNEKANVRSSLTGRIFGGLTRLAAGGAALAEKLPTLREAKK